MKSTLEQQLLQEISSARALFDRFGLALHREPALLRLLSLYRRASNDTHLVMHHKGVIAACTVCALEGPGSCCFEGIEAGYDPILLLINLLMGSTLPDSRETPDSCFFVGAEGCKLRARYYYCLHYLCPALQTSLGPNAKQELLNTVGKELAAGWELEQALREWLCRKSPASEFMLT
jgi:hypothetical protein